MSGDPQAMGAERSHRAPPASHSRSAPVSWVLATASWITTVDHKRIGILYGVTAFAFWLLGLQLLGVSSMIAAINFIVTIVNMRPPGMRLMQMPVFVWMTLVVQFLIVLAFPPITVGLIFLMFDRFFGSHFYDVAAVGDRHLWQHLCWIFGHPEVYILILPAFGIVSEVLPTFSRKPLFGGQVMIYSGVLIGFFGFGVWSHHMFAAGMGPVADAFFAISTMLIAIPTGVKIFNWLATMWGGTIRATVPFHYAAGLVALFTIGGLSGVMHASPPVDLQQTDTYFVVAHFHYVLIGGSLFGILAGASYWWPKMTGRLLDERLGRLGFWVFFAGFNLTFFPQHYLGAIGMPRRIYTYAAGTGWGFWHFWSTVGAFGALTSLALVLIGAAVLVGGSFAFALEHHRNPAHVRQEGGLGVDHRKLAMWVFLGSECFLFGTLIATYMAYKGRSVVGPHPHEILNLPITTLSTFDLLMSSLLMVLALAAVRRGDRFQSRLWLAGTAFFGLIFLGFQAYEFTSFVHEGLTLQTNLFGSTFFVLTGFHGGPVTLGVIWLLTLLGLALRGRLGTPDAVKVEVAGLYWHFVDVVWIVIFTLVYLIP